MDTQFLKLLVCPLCNSPLRHDRSEQELICQHDQLAYPIRNGIPVMLKEEARSLRQNQAAAATSPQRGLASASPESPAAHAADQGHNDATPSGQAKPADAGSDAGSGSAPGSDSASASSSDTKH